MTDYTELVKALRCCIQNPPETCVGCTYNIGNNECNVKRMIGDAAAAIEDLQAEMPKRGKWVEDTTTYAGPGLSNYKCSLCGKICGTWRRGLKPSELPNWCGNCGADMRAKMSDSQSATLCDGGAGMSDLIDREALLDECLNHYEVGNIEQNCTMDWICKTVRNFPAVSPWHRVEVEEPSKAGWYLVMDVDGDFNVDEWHNTFGWHFVTPSDADRITHWMPIEPPKEDA